MRLTPLPLLFFSLTFAYAQGTIPAFKHTVEQKSYTLAGGDPTQGGTTTIQTVLAPITLTFESKQVSGRPLVMDANPDVEPVLKSPIFSRFAFPNGGTTQYTDALLRATFASPGNWHTLLGKPEIKPVKIDVPAGYGYVLSSKKRATVPCRGGCGVPAERAFQAIAEATGQAGDRADA